VVQIPTGFSWDWHFELTVDDELEAA